MSVSILPFRHTGSSTSRSSAAASYSSRSSSIRRSARRSAFGSVPERRSASAVSSQHTAPQRNCVISGLSYADIFHSNMTNAIERGYNRNYASLTLHRQNTICRTNGHPLPSHVAFALSGTVISPDAISRYQLRIRTSRLRLVSERRFQEAQNATTVRFHVPGRGLLLRAIPCIRSRLASGETDATTPGILEKAVPPVTLLPEGHDASVILGVVESEADWTLTICRSNRLLGVTQTANAVTLHVPLNPSRSSVPPAVVRSDQNPPSAIVLRSTWPPPPLIRPPAPMANLPGGQLAVTAWKASDPAVPVALTICRPGGGSAQIAYAWSAHVPAKPVWSSDAATT